MPQLRLQNLHLEESPRAGLRPSSATALNQARNKDAPPSDQLYDTQLRRRHDACGCLSPVTLLFCDRVVSYSGISTLSENQFLRSKEPDPSPMCSQRLKRLLQQFYRTRDYLGNTNALSFLQSGRAASDATRTDAKIDPTAATTTARTAASNNSNWTN